ncbi:MAG TPA: hypothetical protein PLU72_03030 [Candidatus Ozemobacteraceae bacterium]|nr:hypothetical protein [Candidatus Ozemobacteraceae bacterium]
MKTYRCLALVALVAVVTSLLAGCGGGGGGGGGSNPVAATDTTGTTGTTGTTTAADLAAVTPFTKQVDQFVVSYQNYQPLLGATSDSPFAANVKASIARGIRSWTWDATNTGYYWNYYIPGYLEACSIIVFTFYDDSYNHYPYLDSSPLVSKFGACSMINYYEGSSLVSLTENYIFEGIKNPSQITVTGYAEGNANNARVVRLDLNQVVVNSSKQYPLSGTLQLNVSGQGTASITFNGTNIVTLSALMTNGETKSVKYDLATAKALASRRPFEK